MKYRAKWRPPILFFFGTAKQDMGKGLLVKNRAEEIY